MKIELNIDDRLVASTKRIFSRRNLMVLCMLGLLGSVAVYAAPLTVPNEFKADSIISSSAMNENLNAIARGASVFTNPETQVGYSLNASYCGVTAALSSDQGGYAGAKARCATACGTLTAHVCTSQEMLRYVSTGGTMIPAGTYWVQTGALGMENTTAVSDCNGFTTDASSNRGHTWIINFANDYAVPSSGSCTAQPPGLPFVCCD